MIKVNISNRQKILEIDEPQIRLAVGEALSLGTTQNALINLAIVDDPAIHQLNLQFLNHDYPTDVISFMMEETADEIEGEVIVSAETALQVATDHSWVATDELLLYVVHGCLHLVGYDDTTTPSALKMREAENKVLQRFNIAPSWNEDNQYGAHLTEGD